MPSDVIIHRVVELTPERFLLLAVDGSLYFYDGDTVSTPEIVYDDPLTLFEEAPTVLGQSGQAPYLTKGPWQWMDARDGIAWLAGTESRA